MSWLLSSDYSGGLWSWCGFCLTYDPAADQCYDDDKNYNKERSENHKHYPHSEQGAACAEMGEREKIISYYSLIFSYSFIYHIYL